MNIFDAAILGLVEGITEFLPISSTGHLILTAKLLELPQSEFLKSFEIAIQLGAICAVLLLYWRSFLELPVLKKIAAAFIPTALIGFALYSFIKEYLIGNEKVVLVALALGGIILIIFELLHKESATASESIAAISYGQAVAIGFFQAIAVIPGVSRSAATIIGGLLSGLKRTTIVEFSFLLAVPTMAAATGLDVLKSYSSFNSGDALLLLAGFVTAFLVAIVVIKFFLRFIKTHSFISFGVYRILIAALFWFAVL
ncbi:MAG TPA: undecaprenyl-diphosphate phosphatase [Candidatus Paceibacterota bacterium]